MLGCVESRDLPAREMMGKLCEFSPLMIATFSCCRCRFTLMCLWVASVLLVVPHAVIQIFSRLGRVDCRPLFWSSCANWCVMKTTANTTTGVCLFHSLAYLLFISIIQCFFHRSIVFTVTNRAFTVRRPFRAVQFQSSNNLDYERSTECLLQVDRHPHYPEYELLENNSTTCSPVVRCVISFIKCLDGCCL